MKSPKEQENVSKDTIRDPNGRIMYYSDVACGFDHITTFAKFYLHALPNEVEEYCLLPPWEKQFGYLM